MPNLRHPFLIAGMPVPDDAVSRLCGSLKNGS